MMAQNAVRQDMLEAGQEEWRQLISQELKPPVPLRRIGGIPVALMAVLLPWISFLTPFLLLSSKLHFADPEAALAASIATASVFAVSMALGGFVAHRNNQHTGWFWYIGIMVATNFTFGFLLGEFNFWKNMLNYFDVNALNTYKNVDVSLEDTVNGNTLMDAGRIDPFVAGTSVDLSKSNAFIASHTYCVAPIKNGDNMQNFDFWAVGLDCCTKEQSQWACPEVSIIDAKGALRVLNDEMRPYFHLAVEQAASIYNVSYTNPLFFYWLEDPKEELSAWLAEGMAFILASVMISFVVAVLGPAVYARYNVSCFRC